MIEAAIVIPVFALILIGIIQYGMLFAAHITLRNAAAVAVRAARLDESTEAEVRQAARDAVAPLLDPAVLTDADIVLTSTTINGRPAATVTLSYDYGLLFSAVVPGATGGALTLTASSTMR